MPGKRSQSDKVTHKWAFKARFRRHAFGWKSQPAIQRVRQAVSEIRKVARRDPVLAAEGAVQFLERVSPALEHVDSSSGAIGTAVNHAIDALVPIIASAPAVAPTRDAWLERLWEAHANDEIPYIESLAEHWGELCGSEALASAWADRLIDTTRMALSADKGLRGHFHGTTACLSALHHAGRYDEILDIVRDENFWPYKRWALYALAAQGRKADAVRMAESMRDAWTSDHAIDAFCEDMLISSGLLDEAYTRYGLRANRAGTYLATFRAVAKKYPHKRPDDILADLIRTTPGAEGKWFATAKELGLYDLAISLARTSPCDPKTLARAARDHATDQPQFAIEAGCAALDWISRGYGYEISGADVFAAYASAMKAAEAMGREAEVRAKIREIANRGDSFVGEILGRALERSQAGD
jgi:hypothetical protein